MNTKVKCLGDTVPSNNWRFATVHGVCSFPWLPGHVCRKQKHSRIMKNKAPLTYDRKFSYSVIKKVCCDSIEAKANAVD